MNCLQRQPYQCKYCNHFFPDNIHKPCSLAASRHSYNEIRSYAQCHSFKPKHDHCTVCNLRIECVTESTPKEPKPLRNTREVE